MQPTLSSRLSLNFSLAPPPLPQTSTLAGGLSALASLGGYSKWKTPTTTNATSSTNATGSGTGSGSNTSTLGPGQGLGQGLGSGQGQGSGLASGPGQGWKDKDSLANVIREDYARLNSVAMFFLKKSFKHVSILDGGFVAAVRYLRQSDPSLSLSSVLVDAQIPLLDAGKMVVDILSECIFSIHLPNVTYQRTLSTQPLSTPSQPLTHPFNPSSFPDHPHLSNHPHLLPSPRLQSSL